MSRIVVGFLVVTVALLGIGSMAAAHHPPRFESCQRFTFTGELERIEWANPHVLLFIRADDGNLQEVGWLNVQGLERAGIYPDTLRIGDRLVVEGGTRLQEVVEKPILLSVIRRPSDGWEWSIPLQGC